MGPGRGLWDWVGGGGGHAAPAALAHGLEMVFSRQFSVLLKLHRQFRQSLRHTDFYLKLLFDNVTL